jgi:hypothetical protein
VGGPHLAGELVNAAEDEHDELRWVDAAGLAELPLALTGYRALLTGWIDGA